MKSDQTFCDIYHVLRRFVTDLFAVSYCRPFWILPKHDTFAEEYRGQGSLGHPQA